MSKATINLNGGEPIHLLLGEDACREYAEGGVDDVIAAYEDGRIVYEVISINDGDNLFTLLSSMDGWGDWGIITKEDFDKL